MLSTHKPDNIIIMKYKSFYNFVDIGNRYITSNSDYGRIITLVGIQLLLFH